MSNKSAARKAQSPLSKNAQKFLRGMAHDLHPLVTVADKGITDNILAELDTCLNQHELVKIKLRTDRETRAEYQVVILKNTKAQLIQAIGQTLTIFRANPQKPVYELPK